MNVERSGPVRAVFLSYASQDAEAAKRIADALRAAGVEVWFDAEGGLEHGDEWDAKIRRQIKECVLFIAVISANTQAREEGYFRIEWDLAAERARGIASGVAFILPVVIDDTKESFALVPDRFRAVQWTKLRGGELTPEIKARFLKLWSHRTGALKHESGEPAGAALHRDGLEESRHQATPAKGPVWPWIALGVAAAGITAFVFLGRKTPASSAPVIPPAPATSAVQTDAFPRDPELRRTRQLLYTMDAIPEDFRLAEDILQPVLAKQPNDPETATVAAEVALEFLVRGFDNSAARRAQAQRLTERAVQLAPDNPHALATLSRYLLFNGAQMARAEELIHKAISLRPDEARFHRTLHYILFLTRPAAETDAYGERMAAQFPRDPLVAYDIARRFKDSNDLVEMEKWFDRSLASETPVAFAMIWKAWLATWAHCDLAAMKQWIDRVPERQRSNTRVVNARYVHALLSGETRPALRALNELTEEWLTDFDLTVPKTLLIGNLALLEGRNDLARVQFEAALATVAAEMEKNPSDLRPQRARLWVLIGLGRLEEARAIQRILLQSLPRPYLTNITRAAWTNPIISCLLLDLRADALSLLRDSSSDANSRRLLRSMFKLDPRLKPWRDDAEINALLAEPAANGAAATTPLSVSLTPARELVTKARILLLGLEATREDFDLAEEYCQRALKLDPTDGEVWAVYAQLHSAFGYRGWDTSPERREQNRVMAERAIRLAPDSVQAKLAQAGAWSAFGINRSETEKLLRDVVAEQPDNQPALRFLAVTLLNQGKLDECLALNERSAALPGGDPLALFNNSRYLWQRSRPDEAYAMLQRSLAQKSFASALTFKALMEITWRGDPPAAEAALKQIPQAALLEDRANYTAGLVYFYQRRADEALAAWGAFSRDYYADFAFDGPKGLLIGWAHELGQRAAAAKIEWRTALQVVEKRIATAPNKPASYYYQAYLLACLGEKIAAGEALRTYEQLTNIKYTPETPMAIELAYIYARLGRLDELFATAPTYIRRMKIDPRFDTVRADPRYIRLLAEFERQNTEPRK
ncbi:MAG: TIR domain-containing protein [Opitutae bacterium]|nr:TIR domain-containing protein [Opitutae bacterium]